MDTKASADIHLAMDWLRFHVDYKHRALEALDRAILELRSTHDEQDPLPVSGLSLTELRNQIVFGSVWQGRVGSDSDEAPLPPPVWLRVLVPS